MARVQVGIIARRAADGSFLPALPIYREIESIQEPQSTDIFPDALLQLFADKFKEYKTAQSRQKRKESTS